MSYQRIPNQPSAQIAFAVPRDKPELQSILNKALAEIPPKETLSLAGKWIKMPEVKIDTWDLYSRPFYILTVSAILLILSSLLWGGYLLRAIRREKASQAALEYQLSLRQTLSNSIPVPVYITTPEGELKVTTVPSTHFLRRNKREAIHYSLFDRRSPLVHIFPVIQQEMQQGLAPDTVASHQFTLNNGAEDRTILHWMTLCPLPVPLPPVLICGWQDITESRNSWRRFRSKKIKPLRLAGQKVDFWPE
ncbi:hybrid sensory histidine kinase in two-component regulatory system with EvgA [Klebsiella pneumoniae]|uniref:Hybrid sensory histidine kinase in two-component regulatory system with EvgA n=1 Tax=Klebsiella pneumoniae TaxID=573 RepID=A0A377U2N1_KLEPN|nr:hybrid sensory histidine kinase in two-component regulatory system with EvgA [Klebsiella pneumoniae]